MNRVKNEGCQNIFGKDDVFAKAYKQQFQLDIDIDQNGEWSPNFVCSECCDDLMSITSSSSSSSSSGGTNKFIRPMIWKAPTNHPFDCYFCNTIILPGVNPFKKRSIIYANVSSILRPVRRQQQQHYDVGSNAVVEFETEFVTSSSLSRRNRETTNTNDLDDDDDRKHNDLSDDDDNDDSILYPIKDVDDDYGDVVDNDNNDSYDDNDELVMNDKATTTTTTTTADGKFQLTQAICNDLIRDLNLSKIHAELLASRLKNMGLGKQQPHYVRITYYRKRNKQFEKCFSVDNGLTYCNDIDGLYKLFGYQYGHRQPQQTDKWRLFIDSSKSALKAVLLHNGNQQPSVPIAYSKRLNESYENLKFLLEKIKYTQYEWQIVADFKVIGMLMGLKKGWSTYPCFLCLWNSRQPQKHYTQNSWPSRKNESIIFTSSPRTVAIANKFSVISNALVKREKIIFPPLHIKLGLFQQFMKTMVKALNDPETVKKWLYSKRNKTKNVEQTELYPFGVRLEDRNVNAISQICNVILPKKSIPLVLQGNCTGPEIRQILSDRDFIDMLTTKYKRVAIAMKMVISNFLGNHKSADYEYHVEELIDSFHGIGANMSLKLHFLRDHLNEFVEILGDYSDEQGERFHQDIATMEKRYAGGLQFKHMLSDHCWFLLRESKNYQSMWTRKSKDIYFQNVDEDEDDDHNANVDEKK